MDFAAATALACWFAADAGLCAQSTPRASGYSYQFTTKELGVGPAMSLIELERATEWKER